MEHELTSEQINRVLSDPNSPIAQEIARRVAEAKKPGAKTNTTEELLAEIDAHEFEDEPR